MIKSFISRLVNGDDLTELEMEKVMSLIMEGRITPAQIASFITALRIKGETVEEILGAAKAMRKKVLLLNIKHKNIPLLDTCGTGGDAYNTFNISTTCAFIVSAAGVKVAKHGNRAVSSKCGSADVLEALGIKVDLAPDIVKKCIEVLNIGFIFAPIFHRAMKYVAGPRKEIGIRTIFNILGPLTNPAKADIQLLGVFSVDLTEKIAYVLMKLGLKKAFVVCGLDGMDEISICAPTRISYFKGNSIETFEITPEQFGIKRVSPDEIRGGDPNNNAEIIKRVLSGKEKGPKRDIVLINSAAALLVAGRVDNLNEGIKKAEEIIDSGLAIKKLKELIKFTQEL